MHVLAFSSLFEEKILPIFFILLKNPDFSFIISLLLFIISPSNNPVPINNNLGSSKNKTSLIIKLLEYISSKFESYLKIGLYIVKSV